MRTAVDEAAEQQWLLRARAGDRQAFAALVEHYWPRVYRWLYGLAGSTHVAEDLAQETFLSAWSALGRFEGTGFRAWLFRIAGNRLIDLQRSPRSQRSEPLLDNVA